MIAGACTTFSFVPQLLKIWKSKSTHDISLAMYAVISTGVLLWLVYGLLVRDVPIIVANAVALFFTVGILAFKLKYR
ncbi:MAG: SemiSWEET transporter [candidate division Zixibacteria bacterium]|nr:SemiSWEET transporter [candidate division Zixibacteria bacterium]